MNTFAKQWAIRHKPWVLVRRYYRDGKWKRAWFEDGEVAETDGKKVYILKQKFKKRAKIGENR